ncbi:TolC family protein [Lutimonas zeaxanthinifaciens]|uniref:TolC family protein n=1 Tax=Lutimonas zeaxanthinifaciens TaxID=3060215 RepID=UPI00265CA868|nr:TolC family protein [Lutimonas sp. YSD2104]WKK64811.1 TolC family protein [Lutimonas sp. YSD2104]
MYKTELKKSILASVFSLILLASFQNVEAQTSSLISLEEVKAKALDKNKSLKISQQDYAFAKAQYESSRAILLPQIRLSNTSTFTNNPLNAFGFKLLQRDVSSEDFDPDLLNNPGDVENFNTRIELMQPLINVDGWKERKTASLSLQASDLQSQRTEEFIELEAIKTYMQLQLAVKSVEVLEQARVTAGENRIWAKNNLVQGLIQNASYLDMEVRVSEIEHKLQLADSHLKNVSEYLSFLIGEENKAILRPTEELVINSLDEGSEYALNMERKDLLAMQFAVEAQEQMFQSSKMKFIPRANAVANYEWNDASFMGFGANNYLVGLQLSWDIFSGYKNIGKIHQEKAQLEKVNLEKEKYIEESALEVNKAVRQLNDAKKQIELSSLALEQSKEAYRITNNRFREGLEKSKDLLYAETKYHEKELEYAQAIFNFNFSKVYLKYLTQ